jgi:tRNA(Arg) A34 adenosine deaminase TadA
MWTDLTNPWQAAFEMAWEACCVDTVPIGAVITDPAGNVIVRERNRIEDKDAPRGRVHNHQLAHAELNALLQFDSFAADRSRHALYTTMEPCPLCMGAIYMSGLRTVHYAARDPFAGSVDLLGQTWYLSRKPVRAIFLQNSMMEIVSMALCVASDLRFRGIGELDGIVLRRWRSAVPQGVALGWELYNSNEFHQARKSGRPAPEVVDWLAAKVKI